VKPKRLRLRFSISPSKCSKEHNAISEWSIALRTRAI
jgi:hypothetical protein